MNKKHTNANDQWYTIDLHLHTPASTDFQQPETTFLDVLHRAENRDLDIIAITDHNTVAGYRKMQEELSQLNMLKSLNRLLPEEKKRLDEYNRLQEKILVLPGFEFTATFGFHILCIFPPKKPVREIEHLLLSLNIPADQLDDGSQTVGATEDVLTLYRTVNQSGGMVIAAHANSSNGVAMRGFSFGGQTKIAYTQDPNLHALEVTDLEQKGPRSTASFFNGTKPEYPRRMHCIQGSDAHRLTMDPQRKKILGIGDRSTDVLLPERSFEALLALFKNNDFSRTRPHRFQEEPAFDFIQAAQEEGPNIIQDFHESMTVRGGKLYAILADVCAFSNTNGGTLYIGLTADVSKSPQGVQNAEIEVHQLEKEINNRISPPFHSQIDIHEYRGKKVIRILVPKGTDTPYAVDDNKIYVRDESETGLAVRDEIVSLVIRSNQSAVEEITPPTEKIILPEDLPLAQSAQQPENFAPRTGVEVLEPDERQGKIYFTMRDLRNGNIVKNVTRASARKLWHYAIDQYSEIASNLEQINIHWNGNYGLLKTQKQGNAVRFDLIFRHSDGNRFYFGVTPDGIHGEWKKLTGIDEG